MLVKHLVATDSDFEKYLPAQLRLSIQCSTDGFSFILFSSLENKIIEIADFGHDAEEWESAFSRIRFDHSYLFNGNYQSIKILVESSSFLLVPDQFYKQENETKLFETSYPVNKKQKLLVDNLPRLNSKLIYEIDQRLSMWLDQQFPKAIITSHLTHWIRLIHAVNALNTFPYKVFINIRDGYFDLAILAEERIELINTFQFKAAEDAVYHLLNTTRSLGRDPGVFNLIISGKIEQDSLLYNLLYKYVKNIGFAPMLNRFDKPETLKTTSPHLYYTLIHSEICES